MEKRQIKKPTTSQAQANIIDSFAEDRLLCVLVNQPEFLEDSRVTENLFNYSFTKNIFKTIESLVNKKISLSRDALAQEYLIIDQLDADVSLIDRHIFNQNVSHVDTIDDIIDQLLDCNKRRNAIKYLQASIDQIKSIPRLDQDNLTQIKDEINNAESFLSGMDDSIKKVYTLPEWGDYYNKETANRKFGKQYYFRNFAMDSLVDDGPTPGDIGIITSASGSGKSAFALNIVNNCIENDIPVMYFSLEMSGITTYDRLLALRTGIEYRDLVAPKPDQYDSIIQKRTIEQEDLAQHTKFRFSEDANLSLVDIKKHIKKFQSDMGQSYCIVVIDLLSQVQEFVRTSDGINFATQNEISINKLSALCKELGIHCLGIVQLNRKSEGENIKTLDDIDKLKPQRNQIKNSGSYVERARYVLTMFRKKYYAEMYIEDEAQTLEDIVSISIVKQNNGNLKSINAAFNGPNFMVSEIADSLEESKEEK